MTSALNHTLYIETLQWPCDKDKKKVVFFSALNHALYIETLQWPCDEDKRKWYFSVLCTTHLILKPFSDPVMKIREISIFPISNVDMEIE